VDHDLDYWTDKLPRSLGQVQEYLLHRLILEEREIFGALCIDAKNRLIACEDIAPGSISNVNVFPREVVKTALKHNAASVIFYHNHPSGDAVPSQTDLTTTSGLTKILRMIGVRVLDHIIVAGTSARSLLSEGEL